MKKQPLYKLIVTHEGELRYILRTEDKEAIENHIEALDKDEVYSLTQE